MAENVNPREGLDCVVSEMDMTIKYTMLIIVEFFFYFIRRFVLKRVNNAENFWVTHKNIDKGMRISFVNFIAVSTNRKKKRTLLT